MAPPSVHRVHTLLAKQLARRREQRWLLRMRLVDGQGGRGDLASFDHGSR